MREQIRGTISITKDVRNQILIVLLLVLSSLATFVSGMFLVPNADFKSFLLSLSGSLVVSVIIFLFLERGIKSFHPISEISRLPSLDFIRSVKNVKPGEPIRILETFSPLINNNSKEFEEAIRAALRNNSKIEILLFHPLSEGAKRRAEQLKGIDVVHELRKNLARLYKLHEALPDNEKECLAIRLYTALPSVAMYRCGDWAYVSLFPVGSRSDLCPNLKVPMDNPFGSYIDGTFNELWKGTDEAPTIPLNVHMLLQNEEKEGEQRGFQFAYDEARDTTRTDCCFVVESIHAFSSFIHEDVTEKKFIYFSLDNEKWKAEPHRLDARKAVELDEYQRAVKLIEQRYEYTNGHLGRHPVVTRLKNIEKIEVGEEKNVH
jgi:hypothetical protein